MKSHDYLIIGCGRFGSRAIETLLRKDHRAAIIVVDKDEKALEKVSSFHVERIAGDGISFLNQSLKKEGDTYIIPAVPFHLAFEFILSHLKLLGGKRRKTPFIPGLPNSMMGKKGDLYTSLANFLCPEDCPEPPRHCTVTREKRGKSLYKILEDLRGPFESKVIRSKQLGLGVGGYLSEDLLKTVREIKKAGASDRLILISTACRCHGVTSALSL
ncbi:MAG: NAD-binding protein [Deltaproteobacteria bacterium]|nr:NAD-binding protein [Deltaproteobacteria bacterium]